MADQKKIIKVNDLTIEAENVHFAPIEIPERPVYPFFGPRRPRVEQPQPQPEVQQEELEENPTAEDTIDAEQGPEEQTEQQKQPPRRPPFSWI